ncbi:transcription antitermination factor NusB [Actinocorallia longicatena]|uniref:Transcription antitermination protein NusB n=1 Tax=Actinocorallia longicatena TaxID=111803 RepID=A0ABP6QP37_9ACTN
MAARSKARRHAFEILFEAWQRDSSPAEVLLRRGKPQGEELAEHAHAVRIIEGVDAHRERIDDLLATYAVGWTLDRMPAVDLIVLRMGAFELLWADDVPDGVAISEAVALATDFSTEESPKFVNGLLSKLQGVKSTLTL